MKSLFIIYYFFYINLVFLFALYVIVFLFRSCSTSVTYCSVPVEKHISSVKHFLLILLSIGLFHFYKHTYYMKFRQFIQILWISLVMLYLILFRRKYFGLEKQKNRILLTNELEYVYSIINL